jgi:CPA2 family monovalent cation:H+ antiporter-2
MMELALILGVAAVGYGLALRWRIPPLPLLLALGWLLSLTAAAPSVEAAARLVELGVGFLVFAAGLELSPRRFVHQTKAVLWVAVAQFALVGFATYGLARLLGLEPLPAIYIGFAISASSTLVVVQHLRQHQQMFQPFGRLVTGVLLLQDVILILLLVFLVAWPHGGTAVASSLGGLVLLGGLATLGHFWAIPRMLTRSRPDDELLLLLSIAILFAFIGAASLLGLPLIAGAFLAGFSLASFPVNGLVRGLVGSLSDFFQAIFFTALGTLLVGLTWGIVGQAILFAVLVFIITPPIVTLFAEWQGQSSRSGIESGLLLAQASELGIILGLLGWQQGVLDSGQFGLIALVAALTMSLTPFIATDFVTWKILHLHPGRQKQLAGLDLQGHILVLGLGSAGMWVVKPLLQAGHRVLVVEDDPRVIEQLGQTKVAWWRGDGSDEQTLEAVRARQASLILSALPRLSDQLKVIRYAQGVPVVARVFEEAEARFIERAGGIAILNSEAAIEQFLLWFENFCCQSSGSAAGSNLPASSANS